MLAFSPFLALRYLLTRRINLLGVFGVTFAVWAMLVVDGVFTGFVQEIRADVRRSTPDLLVTDLPHETGYDPLRDAIEADDAVAATAPRLRHHGLLQPLRVPQRAQRTAQSSELDVNPMENGFALLLGIDPLREVAVTGLADWIARSEPVLGARGFPLPPSRVLDEPTEKRRAQLLLPDDVEWRARDRAGLDRPASASQYESTWPGLLLGWRRLFYAPWLQEGDPLDLLLAMFPPAAAGSAAKVSTRHDRLAFAGWFATGHRMFDETTALLPIETLRTLLGHDFSDPGSKALVTDVAIRLEPGLAAADVAACKQRLRDAVQGLLPVGSPPCSVVDWEEQNSVFLSAVAHEQGMMQFVLFVVMLVAAFVIYATLHMMVVQKVKDIGILAAIGGSPTGIGMVFQVCGCVVGGLGALLGALLGTLSVQYINPFNDWLYGAFGLELFPRALFDLPRIPCHLTPAWTLQVAGGAFLLALLVAFVPARKASRLHPVKALSYE